MFTSDGGFITRWGTQGFGDGEFAYPEAVAVDASGNVYVADTSNNRIQVFGYPPVGGGEVVLTVYETIVVTDSAAVLPPVLLTVNENIAVVDAPQLLPALLLVVNENISVSDSPQTLFLNPPLMFLVFSPVDIQVTDPDGLIISKTINQIPGATYTETDVNGDGDPDDSVSITVKKTGDYLITVIPEPGASPTDTYSLEASFGGETVILAEHSPVSDIPAGGYHVVWEQGGIHTNPMKSFSINKMTVDFDRQDDHDSINMKASFALPAGVTFDPEIDTVKFNIDGVSIDIPVGSFKGDKKESKYSYDSAKGIEPKVSATLNLKTGEVTLVVKKANVDVINNSDGVTVTFSIASAVSKQTINMYINALTYPKQR